MKRCNKCNIYLHDGINNCPLCGSQSHDTNETMDISFVDSEYPSIEPKPTARKLIKNIFLGINFVLLFISAIISLALMKHEAFTYTLISSLLLWFLILQFIFFPHTPRLMFDKLLINISITLIIVSAVFNSSATIIYPIVIPLIFFAFHCIYSMIVFIRKNWYEYAISIYLLSLMEIILGVTIAILKYVYNFKNLIEYVALTVSIIGLITILSGLIFKKRITITEFKKRFFF